MSGLELAPDLAPRLVRVLADGADALAAHSPGALPDPDGLGDSAAARELAHHAELARRHLDERIGEAATGLRRCGDGVSTFAAGVRAADDALALGLAALARDVT